MTENLQVVVVGAGILGLASAYHILKGHGGLPLLVVERLAGPGRGDTGRSAAAFRDMFSSEVNRQLSRGSIAFYENLQSEGTGIGLKKIGYLWLLTAEQLTEARRTLTDMAHAGVRFAALDTGHLTARLPDLRLLDINQGILGLNCGILDPLRLTGFYEQEVLRLGGQVRYRSEVTGFSRDGQGQIDRVHVGNEEIPAPAVIVATGAWSALTLARAGLAIPLVPRKRQLFSVPAQEGALRRLLESPGFNPYGVLPFTILPGGAYLRPAADSFILGYANQDQPPGLEEPAVAQRRFYESRIRPQAARYFPAFHEAAPSYAWAGHYDEHPPDQTPFVERLAGAIVVGGSSGSGVMKADSLGRIVAGLFAGLQVVKLADGSHFRIADLGLRRRAAPPEEFVI